MRIGNIEIDFPVVMAPIAGMTDGPFRRIVMELGAGMTTTELLSAKALTLDSGKTKRMLPAHDEPGPVAAQIFGADPQVMRDAAQMVEEGRADIIDINFGCPVKKVTKTGGGAALLRDAKLAGLITAAVAGAVKKPVTAKIRIGWDMRSINVVEMARTLEDAGAAAVAIHGRTASQGYSGVADWEAIASAAAAVKIPVIGNGDIRTPESAAWRLKSSGCSAVMIGRAALGAPWIFGWIRSFLETGNYGTISPIEIHNVAQRHLAMMAADYGDMAAMRKMRGWLGYYTRGLRGGAAFRREINRAEGIGPLGALMDEFFRAGPGVTKEEGTVTKS
ncbi:MAG: tRNA dihydrouridine synthase DusB [Nitrospinota bacterium]|nr:tRNA dihydrouridine synthase DusB [Nitrospinota bacterium]MDH5755240.1 tRNA dihydrouridine synthase DusB [Nitrospinota bacterium]